MTDDIRHQNDGQLACVVTGVSTAATVRRQRLLGVLIAFQMEDGTTLNTAWPKPQLADLVQGLVNQPRPAVPPAPNGGSPLREGPYGSAGAPRPPASIDDGESVQVTSVVERASTTSANPDHLLLILTRARVSSPDMLLINSTCGAALLDQVSAVLSDFDHHGVHLASEYGPPLH